MDPVKLLQYVYYISSDSIKFEYIRGNDIWATWSGLMRYSGISKTSELHNRNMKVWMMLQRYLLLQKELSSV